MNDEQRENKRFDEFFRPDGKRGACTECNEMFECEGSLRDGMIKHYQEKHSDRVSKAIAYMDRLEDEIND